jgi:hypothetical protein
MAGSVCSSRPEGVPAGLAKSIRAAWAGLYGTGCDLGSSLLAGQKRDSMFHNNHSAIVTM